jgi:hypothetical protein
MATAPLKSLLLTSLALVPLAGCSGEEVEPSAGNASALASSRQALISNGSQYVFITEAKDWGSAQAHCKGLGLGFNLVTVNDSQEEAFLAQEQLGHGLPQWWIGYNDSKSEGQFSWVGGTASGYQNWAPGQPDNYFEEDCTEDGWDGDGRWNDLPCNYTRPFICERRLHTATHNSSTYVFITDAKSWDSAQGYCLGLDAGFNLVTVNDSQEEDFLAQQQKPYGKTLWWIGYSDQSQEGQFSWVDGSSSGYSNWASSEPNNSGGAENCTVDAWDPGGRWNDYPCAYEQPFICERSTNSAPLVSASPDVTGSAFSEQGLSGLR